jgi:hypothetical protein
MTYFINSKLDYVNIPVTKLFNEYLEIFIIAILSMIIPSITEAFNDLFGDILLMEDKGNDRADRVNPADNIGERPDSDPNPNNPGDVNDPNNPDSDQNNPGDVNDPNNPDSDQNNPGYVNDTNNPENEELNALEQTAARLEAKDNLLKALDEHINDRTAQKEGVGLTDSERTRESDIKRLAELEQDEPLTLDQIDMMYMQAEYDYENLELLQAQQGEDMNHESEDESANTSGNESGNTSGNEPGNTSGNESGNSSDNDMDMEDDNDVDKEDGNDVDMED